MGNLDAQTVLYDTYRSTCTPSTDLGGHLSGQSGEMVLENDVLGAYICTKRVAGTSATCNQASIIFQPYSTYFDNVPANATQRETAWRNTLCHEIGHGVGLRHGSTYGGCMNSGIYTSNLVYSSHHVSHINAYY